MEEARLVEAPIAPITENGNGRHPAATAPGLRVVSETIALQTPKAPGFCDLTSRVQDILTQSAVSHGTLTIFSRHTTAAVRINEDESCLKRDMARFLERLAPCDTYYEHNDLEIRTENLTEDEDLNGHSHCIHMLMGASETIPVINGRLSLGRWQRIFLIELDKPRQRQVVVQVMGL